MNTAKPKALSDLRLNENQREYVREYFRNGKNSSQAFNHVFPHRELKGLDLAKAAHRYKSDPAIKAALVIGDKKELEKIGKVMDRYAITRERVAEELAKIAFAKVDDYLEWGPDGVVLKNSSEVSDEAKTALAEVSETRNEKTGTVVRVKPYDKIAALTALGKTLNMFTEKVEHEHRHVAVSFVIEGKDDEPINIK